MDIYKVIACLLYTQLTVLGLLLVYVIMFVDRKPKETTKPSPLPYTIKKY